MQEASKAYRQAMNRPSRDQFYMTVTIGVVNQEAQENAYAFGEYAAYADLDKPFNNYDVEYSYATFEQDFWRADGTMLYIPKNGPYFNQGIVSKDLLGSAEVRFSGGPYDIKGITIDFGNSYPVDFNIISDNATVAVTGNTGSHFSSEDVFEGASFIRIVPMTMSNGQGRLRIQKLSMGVGIRFTNRQIKGSSKKEFLSWISKELPTIDFSVRVKNENHRFDVENEDSTLNFLEIGQQVTVRYGATLSNGDIEYFDGATLRLDTWKAGDDEMSFSAKDRVADLNNIYYMGKVGEITLYDLAESVFQDAGVDSREYNIDPYLKTITVVNPIPAVTHAEALQMIANAGRCIITVDRKGVIHLKASFTTVVSPERMVVESDNKKPWSNPQNVVLAAAKYDYAMMWQDYWKADGSMFYLPSPEKYLDAGYVSDSIADSSGIFADPPGFQILLEAAFKYYGLTMIFGGNPPPKVVINTYLVNELQESYEQEVVSEETVIEHEFPEFDRVSFSFPKGYPNCGVTVDYVKFGDVTDFSITYKTMTETPVGERLTRYKEIRMQMLRYSESGESKELFKDTVSAGEVYEVHLSVASYGYTSSHGTILKSSAYAVWVDLTGISGEVELIISGREYLQNQSEYVLGLNSTGETIRWSNQLISNSAHAALISEWIGSYLNNNIEYQVPYRGDFRPDAGDIVFLQSSRSNQIQVFLEEHELSFNGGALSGSVRARRAIDGMDTAKNKLVQG